MASMKTTKRGTRHLCLRDKKEKCCSLQPEMDLTKICCLDCYEFYTPNSSTSWHRLGALNTPEYDKFLCGGCVYNRKKDIESSKPVSTDHYKQKIYELKLEHVKKVESLKGSNVIWALLFFITAVVLYLVWTN